MLRVILFFGFILTLGTSGVAPAEVIQEMCQTLPYDLTFVNRLDGNDWAMTCFRKSNSARETRRTARLRGDISVACGRAALDNELSSTVAHPRHGILALELQPHQGNLYCGVNLLSVPPKKLPLTASDSTSTNTRGVRE